MQHTFLRSILRTTLLLALVFGGVKGWGQTAIPNTTAVTQNFDGMGTIATASLPSDWKISPAGAASPTWSASGNFTATLQAASSGVPTTGSRYNWGNGTTTSDRSIGFMTSGGYASPNSIMAFYANTNASNLISLTVSYDA